MAHLARLTLLLAAFVIAACGGDEEPATTPAAAQSQPASTPAASETETTETEAAETSTGVTAPGTELKLGETAKVELKPLDEPYDSKVRFRIDATVEKIEKKSLSDLKGVNLDAEQKKATPYFVSVSLSNPGRTIPSSDDPDVRFDGIDDRGQEQNPVIFIGDFPGCDNPQPPKPFSKGKSYKSCLVYLVPGGGSIDEVRWTGTDEYISKPVVWK